jgi:Phosphoribosyl-ATP pyrophosphohydrolase
MSHQTDVAKFQQKFGHLSGLVPRHLTHRKLLERIQCMQEELNEFTKGAVNQDLEEQADALIDLVYFAIGTGNMLGLPWQALWNDVQRANMSKQAGMGKRGHQVDCIKPQGWVGPQTGWILAAHGYNRDIHNKPELYRDDIQHMQTTDNL